MRVPYTIDVLQEEKKLTVPEIRVWCHPHRVDESGDDHYEVFPTFQDAVKFCKTNKEAESNPLIAIGGYEINIFDLDEEN